MLTRLGTVLVGVGAVALVVLRFIRRSATITEPEWLPWLLVGGLASLCVGAICFIAGLARSRISAGRAIRDAEDFVRKLEQERDQR